MDSKDQFKAVVGYTKALFYIKGSAGGNNFETFKFAED